ncbi:MAG: SDR family NAD(P)-dependent oxidoreductase [Deltaproteobacteria bacterium]|nr:SDR family NAD(P)-dependent oxidoreductase [Deltaproteobacteria bacterium]
MVSKATLITGCSTGIGRATAIQLASAGFPVYATARHPDTIADLAEHGCHPLQLDVTDESSMRKAVEFIEAEHGSVGVLVNNAGYGLEGPVEELSVDEMRLEFETNLFGPTRLTQLVLPAMRNQGWGKIVNLSSLAGIITIPGGGAYHASKHALEALSDALRFELQGFGIDVIVVEPGAIKTRWVETAVEGLKLSEQRRSNDSPYAALTRALSEQLRGAHEGLLGLTAGSPELVARTIERAITSARPRTRYLVPAISQVFVSTYRWLPDRFWDALMRRRYPVPGGSE